MNGAATSELSVLFADVSGSARLHEKLGSTEAVRAVDRCLKRMERAVDGFGGRVIKVVGDELMAVFDSADEAFQAAIEMRQRVADIPPVSGLKLEIRVGFSCGPVSLHEGVITGETVNVAACLAGLAKPGQVLTSLPAQSALSPALRRATRDLGSALGKGKFPAVSVFEAIGPDLGPAAPNSPETPKTEGISGPRLCLRYFGNAIVLDSSKPIIRMGRDPDSDVLIHDRRASRNHARVELRGGRIILIDKSTNGTFLSINGIPELFLRNGECELQGKGTISFAASVTSHDADSAEFELI